VQDSLEGFRVAQKCAGGWRGGGVGSEGGGLGALSLVSGGAGGGGGAWGGGDWHLKNPTGMRQAAGCAKNGSFRKRKLPTDLDKRTIDRVIDSARRNGARRGKYAERAEGGCVVMLIEPEAPPTTREGHCDAGAQAAMTIDVRASKSCPLRRLARIPYR